MPGVADHKRPLFCLGMDMTSRMRIPALQFTVRQYMYPSITMTAMQLFPAGMHIYISALLTTDSDPCSR